MVPPLVSLASSFATATISWKSPLFKGLQSLDIRTPSENARPRLAVWLDVLNEMPHLKRLVLHSASPSAPRFQSDVERTATLPSLTHINISDSESACVLALAHLVRPALTWLCIAATSYISEGGDAHRILQYIAQHAHSSQDTRPLQSALIHCKKTRVDILAWTGATRQRVDSEKRFRNTTVVASTRCSRR
jgi:hypothetical protein